MNDDLHSRAMELLDEARLLELRGTIEGAREKYEAAAMLEEQCAETTGDDEPRSRGILSVGAVSLWMRAGRLDRAEALVQRYVSGTIGPGFHRELLELLKDIRRQRKEANAAPVEPDERAAALAAELRKTEEDLAAGRVRLWAINSAA